MALNIKNPAVEQLAAELAELTGETKTEAIRRALEERRKKLAFRVSPKSREDVMENLDREIWSKVPASLRGRKMSKKKWEDLLGYGKKGA